MADTSPAAVVEVEAAYSQWQLDQTSTVATGTDTIWKLLPLQLTDSVPKHRKMSRQQPETAVTFQLTLPGNISGSTVQTLAQGFVIVP